MSHTLHWGSSDDRWAHFHHEGDYSGYVTIVQPEHMAAIKVDQIPGSDESVIVSVRVPFKALKALFISYLRNQAIDFVESMTDKEIERYLIGLMKADMENE